MEFHLTAFTFLIASIIVCIIQQRVEASAVSPFTQDQDPVFKKTISDSDFISSTSLNDSKLTFAVSNSTFALFGSSGAVYAVSFDHTLSQGFKLEKKVFTGVSCSSESKPSCYETTRIVRRANDWAICASKRFDTEIQRYSLSSSGKLIELKDTAKEAMFYCPFHGSVYLAVDLNDFSIRLNVNKGFTISKVVQSEEQKTVQSSKIEQSVTLIKEFKYKDEVWFVFASQSSDGSGPQAQVARVCSSDPGVEAFLFGAPKTVWTTLSFLTLGCYFPGAPEFVFQELTDAYFDINSKAMYTAFRTPGNSIPGSAICKFDLDEISRGFEGERTEEFQNSTKSSFNMFSCDSTRYSLSDQQKNFLTRAQNVKEPFRKEPIFTVTRQNYRFDKLAMEHLDDSSKMLYIFTDFGSILKVLLTQQNGKEVSDWQEFLEFGSKTKSGYSKLEFAAPLDFGKLVLALDNGKIAELPSSSCDMVKSCRGCFKLEDLRCSWLIGEESRCSSKIPQGFSGTSYSVTEADVNKICENESPIVPNPDDYPENGESCEGCDFVDAGDSTSGVVMATTLQKETLVENKTTFALIVAVPTFVVGLTLGMGVLFLYAYCRARTGGRFPEQDTTAYDCEYGRDGNVYEDPPTPKNYRHKHPTMAPKYFSHDQRGFEKDYDLIHGLKNGGSPQFNPSMILPNGQGYPVHTQPGMLHYQPNNGYMVGPAAPPMFANGGPPPVPKRPRNMSSPSTSSEGMDPTLIDPSVNSRTPYDDRFIYQVPRENNRFSAHEYEVGDCNIHSIPEDESTPMMCNYGHDSEQHSSLRRGQTMPRNGNGRLTDQHIEDEFPHNSLPRQVSTLPSQANKYISSDSANYYLLPVPSDPNIGATNSKTNSNDRNSLSPVKEQISPSSEFPPPPEDLLDSPNNIYTSLSPPCNATNRFSFSEPEASSKNEGKASNKDASSWIYHMPKLGGFKPNQESSC